jgi:hypothetical protein
MTGQIGFSAVCYVSTTGKQENADPSLRSGQALKVGATVLARPSTAIQIPDLKLQKPRLAMIADW